MCKLLLLPLAVSLLVITDTVKCLFLIEKGEPKGPIVQLFEWRFDDIAEECERFLGPNGFSGVQVSPVTESVSLDGDPWHERYQPISYKIGSRSGNKAQFRKMMNRCSKSQVKVYVEVVINHMTKKYESKIYGTDYSYALPAKYNYPDVPYVQEDFRSQCELTDYNNASQVRNCAFDGLLDLDQSKHAVRCRISHFLNDLIEMGVAGFSFSHAKYMWPEDLRAIIDRVDYLSFFQGFGYFERPFIYQEFVEGGVVKHSEYYELGLVTDFKYSFELTQAFSGKKDLVELKNLGKDGSLVASERALVFVDNHLTQRGQGYGGIKTLSYKEARRYTLANVFMLAWPHGQPRIMSGYEFHDVDQGPPKDKLGYIARVQPKDNGICANGWTCEHRWLLINQMMKFREYVKYLPIENWWDNGKNQIAFSRGDKGFVVFNLDSTDMNDVPVKTGLPPGSYCDIFSGFRTFGGQCTGKRIIVEIDGTSKITLKASDKYGVIAIFLLTELPPGLYCDVISGIPAQNGNCTGKEIIIDSHAVGRFTLEKKNIDDILIIRPDNTKKRARYYEGPEVRPQHWNEVYRTVKFSVHDQTERFYIDIPQEQYALGKGKKGFMIFKTTGNVMVDVPIQTGLPSGLYCDMISGMLTKEEGCTGKTITVELYGIAKFTLKEKDNIVVIHEGALIE